MSSEIRKLGFTIHTKMSPFETLPFRVWSVPSASIAQWIEHWSCKPGVGSSILPGGCMFSMETLSRHLAIKTGFVSFRFKAAWLWCTTLKKLSAYLSTDYSLLWTLVQAYHINKVWNRCKKAKSLCRPVYIVVTIFNDTPWLCVPPKLWSYAVSSFKDNS